MKSTINMLRELNLKSANEHLFLDHAHSGEKRNQDPHRGRRNRRRQQEEEVGELCRGAECKDQDGADRDCR